MRVSDPELTQDLPSPYDLREAALSYAAAGYRVLPCHSRATNGWCTCGKQGCSSVGKHPRTRQGVTDATDDVQTVRRWWKTWPDANVGIAGGGAQRLLILDVDGQQGRESLGAAELPHTPTANTPRGRHYFFRAGPAWGEGQLPNSVGFRPGLDLRGDGGYVVAAPSLHASGLRYWWEPGATFTAPLAETPSWLTPADVEACRAEPQRPLAGGLADADDPQVYAEGRRNAGLCSLAGAMRRQGAGEKELLAALCVANRVRCRPPLEHAEVQAIAASVCKYAAGAHRPVVVRDSGLQSPEPTGGSDPWAHTDVGNAEAFVQEHGAGVRYNVDAGKWHQWNGTRWERDELGAVQERVIHTVRRRRDAGLAQVGEVAQKLVGWARRSEGDARIKACLQRLMVWRGLAVRSSDFDADPWLFNAQNGIVDLRTMEVRRHHPEAMCSRIAGAELALGEESRRWQHVLYRVTCGKPGLEMFLRRAFGYAMTGVIRDHCFFTCYGLGANGKTTVLETVMAALGDYAVRGDVETFLQRDRPGASNDLARLEGARLVVASEADEGRRLSEATVKGITGGDGIVARFMYKEFHEFKPQFKLFLATNHKPRIYGTDHGMWRRVRLIPFSAVIPEEEQDGALPEKLLAELAGVLAWIAAGCFEWMRDGLGQCREVNEATAEYREAQDLLGGFFEECLETVERELVASEEVFRAYVSWAEEAGERPLARRALGNRIAERGYRSTTRKGEGSRQHRCWVGLRLREAGRQRAGGRLLPSQAGLDV